MKLRYKMTVKKELRIDKINRAAKSLRVLAHPVRLKIMEYLESGEKNVGMIQKHIGLLQAVTSQHLKIMSSNRLLKKRREGNFIYYRVNDEILNGIMNCIRDCKV